MKRVLNELYVRLKRAHMGKWAEVVPERYWSNFVNIGGAAEQVYALRRLIGLSARPLRVLVVGVFGGRDFWAMKMDGHYVTGLDLASVTDCPPTIKGDAEDEWPFATQQFDVVIMGEVLEHLIYDYVALREARRVLRADGRLVGSVPFLHDSAEHHVRVHTPQSIRRLLRIAGFEPTDFVERPGLFSLRGFNYVNHFLALTYFLVRGRSLYPGLLGLFGPIEWFLGHRRWVPRHLLKMAGLVNWGATFAAVPVDSALDYKADNRNSFVSSGEVDRI